LRRAGELSLELEECIQNGLLAVEG